MNQHYVVNHDRMFVQVNTVHQGNQNLWIDVVSAGQDEECAKKNVVPQEVKILRWYTPRPSLHFYILLLASFKSLHGWKMISMECACLLLKTSSNAVFLLGMRLSEHKCGTHARFAFFCCSLTRANAPDLRFWMTKAASQNLHHWDLVLQCFGAKLHNSYVPRILHSIKRPFSTQLKLGP